MMDDDDDDDDDVGQTVKRVKPYYSKKPCSSSALFTTNPT
jgi:hypothetical protein